MADPQQLIGTSFTLERPYTISREKIAEFAQAIGDDNPAYQGDDPVAPPTIASVLVTKAWNAMFARPDFDLELKRMIHADQSFEWNRPIRAGDTFTITLVVDDLKKRGHLEYLTVSVHLVTLGGEEVAVSHSTLIHNRAAYGGEDA
jgi:acyl dehydratase